MKTLLVTSSGDLSIHIYSNEYFAEIKFQFNQHLSGFAETPIYWVALGLNNEYIVLGVGDNSLRVLKKRVKAFQRQDMSWL